MLHPSPDFRPKGCGPVNPRLPFQSVRTPGCDSPALIYSGQIPHPGDYPCRETASRRFFDSRASCKSPFHPSLPLKKQYSHCGYCFLLDALPRQSGAYFAQGEQTNVVAICWISVRGEACPELSKGIEPRRGIVLQEAPDISHLRWDNS
jgi:hypothetical protein